MKKQTKRDLEIEVANLRGQVSALEGQLAAMRLMQPIMPFVPMPNQPPVNPPPYSPWWEVKPYWELLPRTFMTGGNQTECIVNDGHVSNACINGGNNAVIGGRLDDVGQIVRGSWTGYPEK